MSILDTLVYNRTAEHVERLRQLLSKSWAGMTAEEKYEYTYGSPVQIQDSLGQNLYTTKSKRYFRFKSRARKKCKHKIIGGYIIKDTTPPTVSSVDLLK